MIDPHTLLLFFSTSLLLAVSPGPDNLFVMAQSLQNGRAAGFSVTLGLCTGLFGHTAAVAFGLAAIIQASALAFTVLKLCGAAYLLVLAWQAFRAGDTVPGDEPVIALSSGALYMRGIVMNLTNPKVSLFFLAFLPQFADPSRGSMMMQFIFFGVLFILATVLVFGLITLLAGRLGENYRRSPLAGKIINRMAALIFIGLAFRLATAGR